MRATFQKVSMSALASWDVQPVNDFDHHSNLVLQQNPISLLGSLVMSCRWMFSIAVRWLVRLLQPLAWWIVLLGFIRPASSTTAIQIMSLRSWRTHGSNLMDYHSGSCVTQTLLSKGLFNRGCKLWDVSLNIVLQKLITSLELLRDAMQSFALFWKSWLISLEPLRYHSARPYCLQLAMLWMAISTPMEGQHIKQFLAVNLDFYMAILVTPMHWLLHHQLQISENQLPIFHTKQSSSVQKLSRQSMT